MFNLLKKLMVEKTFMSLIKTAQIRANPDRMVPINSTEEELSTKTQTPEAKEREDPSKTRRIKTYEFSISKIKTLKQLFKGNLAVRASRKHQLTRLPCPNTSLINGVKTSGTPELQVKDIYGIVSNQHVAKTMRQLKH